ncbi:MAG: thiamine pyrophosphate-binding protein, partial [Planctomycetota bacterium]|nr:thiamine pyrophosphate-binding protein [Planctomycetota bacterium]
PALFTLCGGHTAPILVAAKREGLEIIDVRHEASAVFAADASARLSGRPGVAVVTAGPGVTNTVTAVKNAQEAQSPVVLIGGAAPTVLRGRGALQDIDQKALLAPHVKAVLRVTRVGSLQEQLSQALTLASSPIPGPVFLECPLDLLYDEELVREWYLKGSETRTSISARLETIWLKRHLGRMFGGLPQRPYSAPPPPPQPAVPSAPLARAAALLRNSERPLLLLGSGAMVQPNRAALTAAAVESLGLPVFLSGMSRGLLGANSLLQVRHRRREALREADLIILAGSPTDFRLEYGRAIPRRTRLIKVNYDRRELRKNRRPDIGIKCDPGLFIEELARVHSALDYKPWRAALAARDAERESEINAPSPSATTDSGVHPVALCQAMAAAMAQDATMVGDGGDFVATAAYILRPGAPLHWLDPGVFGTLGMGGGFALAAALERRSTGGETWLLWGDGSCAFSLAEFDTLARHGLGLIAVVGNDGSWSQIARDQVKILGDDVGTALEQRAYHTVAEGYGGRGLLVTAATQLPTALAQAKAWAADGIPVLVNVHLTKSDFREGSLSM